MPMPQDYQTASQIFDRILEQVKDELSLATRNQAYTTLQAVLFVFRRRLTPDQVLQFADILPAMIRAIFVADWETAGQSANFRSRDELTREVQSFRRNHNFSPDNAISGVAKVIKTLVDANRFDAVLQSISTDAVAYWRITD